MSLESCGSINRAKGTCGSVSSASKLSTPAHALWMKRRPGRRARQPAGIGRHGDLHIGQNIRRGRARRISGPGHDLLVAQRRLQRAGPGGQGRRRQIGEEQDGHALSFL
jgi:hypothetical protein